MKIGRSLVPILTMLALAGCSQGGTPAASTLATTATAGGTLKAQDLVQITSNAVDASGNPTFVAGTSTSISFYILATGGGGGGANNPDSDSENGCNAKAGSPANVTITTSGQLKIRSGTAQVNSTTLQFTTCATAAVPAGKQAVQFEASSPGVYLVQTTVQDGGTGTYRLLSFSITVTQAADTEKPVITSVGPTTLPNAAGWYAGNVVNTFKVTDNAGFALPVPAGWTQVKDASNNPVANAYTFTKVSTAEGSAVTLSSGTVTDAAGNESAAINSAPFKIDLTDPTNVAFVGGFTSAALGSVPAEPNCTATDALSGLASCVVSGYSTALGEHTLTATATDKAGRIKTATLAYTVSDQTAPTITDQGPTTTPNDAGWYKGAVTNTFSATDNVGLVAGFFNPFTKTTSSEGAAVKVASGAVSDATGNLNPGIDSTAFKIDLTSPSGVSFIGGLANDTQYSFGSVPAAPTCTATDALSGLASCEVTGYSSGIGTHTLTATATDVAGNSTQATLNYTVKDTTPPAFTNVPAPAPVEATSATGAVVTFTLPTATDLVDGVRPVTCTPASGSTLALGTTTVSCTASDNSGNPGSTSFSVLVRDTTPPVLEPHANVLKEATSAAGAAVTYTDPIATDAVGPVTVTCTLVSGSTFALGDTTVTCTATDSAGNKSTSSFTITVQDKTPPILHLPETMLLEATGLNGAVATFAATATDLVDGIVAVTCNPTSPATLALGEHTITCSAKDVAGNLANGSFTITVKDTTKPTLGTLTSIIAEATGPAGAVVPYPLPTATDIASVPTVVCTPANGATFPIGASTVNCTATDGAGLEDTGSFTVTVKDTVAPVLTVPSNIALEGNTLGGRNVDFTATATDLVTTNVIATCDKTSGSLFPVGTTTVSCSATDGAGNSSSSTFTITVVDTTEPVLALSANLVREATGPNGAAVTFSNSATDLVSGNVSVGCAPASGATFPLGTTTVTCTAPDAAGNTASGSFTVKVQDTTAPVLATRLNIPAFATANGAAIVTYSNPTATDAVSTPTVSCTPASGASFPVGTNTVTCKAIDAAGNFSTGTFNVIVSYNFTGFFQPIDMGNVYNTVKAGSAVPVKFKLGGNQGPSIFAPGYPLSAAVACNLTAPVDDIEELSAIPTASTPNLTYDATAGQYVYVWKTDSTWKAGTCRQLTVSFMDGTTQSAFFKFK